MKIEELNQLRDQFHREFINRQPANEKTTSVIIGIGNNGISSVQSELLKALASAVADCKLDNTLVYFSTEFENAIKIVKFGKADVMINDLAKVNALDVVQKYVA